ncbi:hypothetical protein BH11PSE5_BH11PSE5_30160 [soil metagenome]
MFEVSNDLRQRLITVRLSGFLTLPEVDDFFAEEQRQAQASGYRSNDFLLLVEAEGSVIQSQDIVTSIIEHIARAPLRARRVAVVREGTMTKLQTQRMLANRENASIFGERSDALNWLLAG